MTKKETIYNALGIIEGVVCVSQKNTREVLMKAIDMIRDAIEEKTEREDECCHEWVLKEKFAYPPTEDGKQEFRGKFFCRYCGDIDMRDI